VSRNSPWTPIECTWMPMSDWEQPLNTHWMCLNANQRVWTPIECAWMPLNHFSTLNAFVWELNGAWMQLSALEHLWVSIEHPLNAVECMWAPLSEYWIWPECFWVCMNANEWVGTAPEHLLSVHECLWVSIWKVWMRTSRVVNWTNLYGWFKLRVEYWHQFKILCYG